jgi:hypothetical protein
LVRGVTSAPGLAFTGRVTSIVICPTDGADDCGDLPNEPVPGPNPPPDPGPTPGPEPTTDPDDPTGPPHKPKPPDV